MAASGSLNSLRPPSYPTGEAASEEEAVPHSLRPSLSELADSRSVHFQPSQKGPGARISMPRRRGESSSRWLGARAFKQRPRESGKPLPVSTSVHTS